jgi:hypothetical protein
MKLLTIDNAKTTKGEKLDILTGILYLAPAKISGYEVCPQRSIGCTLACLYTAGMGIFSNVQNARIKKTKMFFEDRAEFFKLLRKDIVALEKKAIKLEMKPAVRLNGTSDINWVRFKIMEEFPSVQFYDYTKVVKHLTKDIPNYNITFSRNEANDDDCKTALNHGYNVAVVFNTKKGERLPATWESYPVVDGDETDVRFLDNAGSIVGIRAKGEAKKDRLGFVIKTVS